jgi:hypothetical protein
VQDAPDPHRPEAATPHSDYVAAHEELGKAIAGVWEQIVAGFKPLLDFINSLASAPKPPKRKPLIHNGRKHRK